MTTKTEDVFDTDETRELIETFRSVTASLREQVGKVIIGQTDVVEHLLVTLLVGGHCLITGMPGTAKTLLVKTLADALGLTFKRIQFTPDLMPTDVTGTDIIEEDSATGHRSWTFVEGPVFTNVLLADEINQSHAAKNAGGIARGHAGENGNGARQTALSIAAISCTRDAEPD